MSNKDKVLAALLHAQLCDDCLSISSNVTPRQTVYSICRTLSDLWIETMVSPDKRANLNTVLYFK